MSGDLRTEVEFELAELQRLIEPCTRLAGLPPDAELDPLELGGAGAMLHSFYSGVENVLTRIALATSGALPDGPHWHRQLLQAAAIGDQTRQAILDDSTARFLDEYLAYRHAFRHSYMHRLAWERMAHLVQGLPEALDCFARCVSDFLDTLDAQPGLPGREDGP